MLLRIRGDADLVAAIDTRFAPEWAVQPTQPLGLPPQLASLKHLLHASSIDDLCLCKCHVETGEALQPPIDASQTAEELGLQTGSELYVTSATLQHLNRRQLPPCTLNASGCRFIAVGPSVERGENYRTVVKTADGWGGASAIASAPFAPRWSFKVTPGAAVGGLQPQAQVMVGVATKGFPVDGTHNFMTQQNCCMLDVVAMCVYNSNRYPTVPVSATASEAIASARFDTPEEGIVVSVALEPRGDSGTQIAFIVRGQSVWSGLLEWTDDLPPSAGGLCPAVELYSQGATVELI